MSKTNSRAIAASILAELLRGSGSLATHLGKHDELEDFPLLQEMCFGTCRWFHQLEFILNRLVSKPLKDKDSDIKCLIVLGFYQLRHLSIPDYAAINETVNGTGSLGKHWAKSLVNGVLRNYLRSANEIDKALEQQKPAVRLSHPEWLVQQLEQQWPEQSAMILDNNNLRPPMTLRVNLSITTRDDYQRKLNHQDIASDAGRLTNSALYLSKPQSVHDLPGFIEGQVSVQDEASQLVPELLQLEPGLRILDACCAPGGKTCHILESERSLTSVTAIDREQGRLARVEENLQRLGLKADLKCSDASKTSEWWDGKPFDRILLDAPCSATGVIRRHPDIKLLRSPKNLVELCASQQQLLHSLWPCLQPGGLLLYTTCSLLKQENEDAVQSFLDSVDNAKYEGIAADWGVECRNGRQLLTGSNREPDGFFFSVLRKLGSAQ